MTTHRGAALARTTDPDARALEVARAAVTLAIEEVLASVMQPALVRGVLDKALQFAGFARPPVSRMALRYFIEGPLHQTVAGVAGQDTADCVFEELRQIADRAAPPARSGVRRAMDYPLGNHQGRRAAAAPMTWLVAGAEARRPEP